MNKIIISLLAVILLLGNTGEASAKTIGVALASDTNPFYIAMPKGIRARAKKAGYDVSVVNAEEDIAKNQKHCCHWHEWYPPAVAAVNRGFMDLTVGLSPFAFGNVGVDTMVARLSGKSFGKKVLVGYVLIDKGNAKKFMRPKKKK